jgi:hypothetical protein
MQETITMTSREQRRAWILTKLLVGEVTTAEAAALLGRSERQVWRLRRAFERDGPAALVHGNRGRPSRRRLAEPVRHVFTHFPLELSVFVAQARRSSVAPTPGPFPGHVSIPELSFQEFKKAKERSKDLQRKLAVLASRDIVLRPSA